MLSQRTNYESDDAAFPSYAYTVDGWDGIAWHVFGWALALDAESEWTGIERRSGLVVCVMIGDDRKFLFEPDDITPISREEYCGQCGQIGCGHG